MSDQRSADRYELYRVISDYEALQDGFLDRIDDLDTTISGIPGFADGVVQKLLSKNPGKSRDTHVAAGQRKFGWKSLGEMLKATGLALVLIVDDERFAEQKAQLAKRRRKMPPIAGMKRPAWLFTKKTSREMGKKRFASMTESKFRRHQRKAAKARWRRRAPGIVPVEAANA
jgi:hypothetical protein